MTTPPRPRCTAAALVAASISALALADTATLTINPAMSSIDVTATLDTPVGADTDTATSTISGSIEVELDDYGTPTAITIVDFAIVLDQDASLNFSYGFLGSADATLQDAVATYATPGIPTGPTGVDGAGVFSFPEVPAALIGTASYNYSFFLAGSGSDTINLADTGTFVAPISGEITTDANFVYLDGGLTFNVSQPVADGLATLTLSGTATLAALGDRPVAGGCNPADLEPPFGVLDLTDIGTFIDAFLLSLPAADLAPPAGVYDLNDLQVFIAEFLAGCP